VSLKLRKQIEWNIIVDFVSQYLEWMKKDLTQLDETFPKWWKLATINMM
jgi:hypothetical protein